jgi:hypothetical protein
VAPVAVCGFSGATYASLELGGGRERSRGIDDKQHNLAEIGGAGAKHLHWHFGTVSVHRLASVGMAYPVWRPLPQSAS